MQTEVVVVAEFFFFLFDFFHISRRAIPLCFLKFSSYCAVGVERILFSSFLVVTSLTHHMNSFFVLYLETSTLCFKRVLDTVPFFLYVCVAFFESMLYLIFVN